MGSDAENAYGLVHASSRGETVPSATATTTTPMNRLRNYDCNEYERQVAARVGGKPEDREKRKTRGKMEKDFQLFILITPTNNLGQIVGELEPGLFVDVIGVTHERHLSS